MTALATPPPLERLGVIGVGLLGGSVALRAREVWPDIRISGVDPVSAPWAVRSGVIDEACESYEALPQVDLLVLAGPVPVVIDGLHEIGRVGCSATITDVGSTKRTILAAARAARVDRFVGGHPVAGAERGGVTEARADLFEGRPWAVVADEASEADAELVCGFARALGARPVRTTAVDHDRTMALVSHLPQLVSIWLARTAAERADPLAAELAGRAMVEMTRLASSPPDLWAGILQDNADFVREAVEAFGAQVVWPGSGIPARLHEMFGQAATWRATLGGGQTPGEARG